ncbi:hypothetical protein B0H17DRAFT_1193371 [Mycena rosella]|uniref:DUF6533 domain-containing protein n=1 Tax=Mycena rosella TaxID=1033263 RepID=A0AAD7M7Q8_MYCRO|nr:hypothetical protein B0H17DRAFT_1193371 [Mycena rosella]
MNDELSDELALSWSRLQTVKASKCCLRVLHISLNFRQYVNVASMAILVFDYCLTLDLEVSLVWPSRMTLSKTLFVLSRYTPFFDVPVGLYYILTPNVPLNRCFNLNLAATVMSVFGIAIGEAILFLPQSMGYFLAHQCSCLSFLQATQVGASATVVMVSMFLRSMEFGPPILAAIPGCNQTGGSFILIGACFILVLLNETALMSYTLWLGFKTYRHSRNPLIVTLYRDGVMYFMFLFMGSTANFAILIAGEASFFDLPTFRR